MKKKKDKSEMSFLDHLEELRWHLIRSALAITVFATLAFIYSRYIFDYVILAPRNKGFISNKLLCKLGELIHVPSLCINSKPFTLISTTMSGQFSTDMTVSVVAGFIIASPFVFYEFWKFVAPALHSNERKHTRGAVYIISSLFLVGILFGYYLIVPFSVDFFGSYNVSSAVTNNITLDSYVSIVGSIVLASGLVFELPVLVFFLSKIGIMSPTFMRKYRRHAIVVILVVAAVITPPDVISQTLVSIPLVILYEASIFISAFVHRKKKRAEGAA